MEFDPAFALLKKFTVGIPSSLSESDTINAEDVAAAAKYLGIELREIPLSGQIGVIEIELLAQNKFLTTNLQNTEVEQSEFYRKSQFVREVISNNRRPRTQ
jgi:hypothetical protein